MKHAPFLPSGLPRSSCGAHHAGIALYEWQRILDTSKLQIIWKQIPRRFGTKGSDAFRSFASRTLICVWSSHQCKPIYIVIYGVRDAIQLWEIVHQSKSLLTGQVYYFISSVVPSTKPHTGYQLATTLQHAIASFVFISLLIQITAEQMQDTNAPTKIVPRYWQKLLPR